MMVFRLAVRGSRDRREVRFFGRCAVLAVLSVSLALISTADCQEGGIIEVLFIGDPFMRPGFPTPALVEDPKIRLTPVVGELAFVTRKEMAKAMRIYLPRTQKHLSENHDLVALAAIRSDHLSGAFHSWVATGVLEGELALLMADDPVSFAGVDAWEGAGAPGWMETPVGAILPVDDRTRINYEDIWFKFKPASGYEDHPFNTGIPWEQVTVNTHNRPTARPGATVLMETSQETPFSGYGGPVQEGSPVVVFWDIEMGRSMALVFDWGGNGVTEFYRWEYWRDIVARWFYLPARAEILEDVALSHKVRQMIAQFGVQKGITLSMLEFADKFGANTVRVEEHLAMVNEDRRKADSLWIEGDFQGCGTAMETALAGLQEVEGEALKAKDDALLWIYISEWTAVSGTLCVTGFVVWSLMIRRVAYREVGTTRSGPSN